jgi:LysR family nitrogen assimilation transcriptional regulator
MPIWYEGRHGSTTPANIHRPDLCTVSKAAVRLRIAEPALSRQISALEQELGLKLFERVGRRLVLTGEGEQLLGDCRSLIGQANSLGERAGSLRHGDSGVLKVAATPHVIESVLSEIFGPIRGTLS